MAFHLQASEVKHYLMINVLIDHLRKEGYSEIEADHLVSTCPPQEIIRTDGPPLVPDVVAGKDGRKLIFEVKTEEMLFDPETEEQIRTFYSFAEETGSEFCLLIPQRSVTRVKYLLDGLGLPDLQVFYI